MGLPETPKEEEEEDGMSTQADGEEEGGEVRLESHPVVRILGTRRCRLQSERSYSRVGPLLPRPTAGVPRSAHVRTKQAVANNNFTRPPPRACP